jgi:hypothetical protein
MRRDPRRVSRPAVFVAVVAVVLVLAATIVRLVRDDGTGAVAAVSGPDVAVPVYVHPGDPYFQRLLNPARIPPSVVVVNIGNGDGDVSMLDDTADALRARRTAHGAPVRVLGYVWTSEPGRVASRPVADITAVVDRWLAPRGGRVHYDGIFFDVTPSACGPVPGSNDYRDRYWELRRHVRSRLPETGGLVVNNAGVPVAGCYLAPERRTADTFVTFEGPERAYRPAGPGTGGSWSGGNVRLEGSSPAPTGEPAAGAGSLVTGLPLVDTPTFWHIVYDVEPGRGSEIVRLAHERGAGHVTATDDDLPGNPFDVAPVDLDEEIAVAGRLA